MSEPSASVAGRSPPALALRMDAACDRFESAWRAGQRPRIEDVLGDFPEVARPALLRDLLGLELAYRRLAGGIPDPEEYRARFPDHPAEVHDALEAASTSPDGIGRPPTAGEGAAREAGPGLLGARYRILRPHARGGLGEVYLARDERLRRRVALKEIQVSHSDRADSRARFVREAEITGRLEHPGIVPVYELGYYGDGRPYYAMRFIEGDSLGEAIERHQKEGHRRVPGERTLKLRDLLGRFVGACNAVAYAHSRGVIHRDLKPANIMLGPFGETLVVDWGLAKPSAPPRSGLLPEGDPRPSSTEGEEDTLPGVPLGTPQYMSPEQAAGEPVKVGPASNVYGLGATLYCLLTGRPPFEDRDLAPVLQRVIRGDFPPPRQVRREVPRGLEAICLKAMAMRPEDRYESVRSLADDVESWLAGEPVSAWREPPWTRLDRWGRRHRPLVVGVAATLIATVVALSIGTVLLGRQRDRAERNFGLARRVVDEMYLEAAEGLSDREWMDDYQRQVFQRALHFYEVFALEQSRDPAVRFEAALAAVRVSEIQAKFGRMKEAGAAGRLALERLEQLHAEDPREVRYAASLAYTWSHLGLQAESLGRPAEALAAHRRALAIREELMAREPSSTPLRHGAALSHLQLGELALGLGRNSEAGPEFARALRLWEALVDERPRAARYRSGLADGYTGLGMLRRHEGRSEQAESAHRKAAEIRERLVAVYPRDTEYRDKLAKSLNNLAALHADAGRYADAVREQGRAIQLTQALTSEHPDLVELQARLATYEMNLGIVLSKMRGRLADAEAAYLRAAETFERLAPKHPEIIDLPKQLAWTLNNLAIIHEETGARDRARAEYERGVEVREALAAAHPEIPDLQHDLAASLGNLGLIDRSQGRLVVAERRVRRAAEILEPLVARHPEVISYRQSLAQDRNTLGVFYVSWGRLGDAEREHRRAVALREGLVREHPDRIEFAVDLGGGYCNLATLLKEQGRYDASRERYDRAVEVLTEATRRSPENDQARRFLFNAYWGRATLAYQMGEYVQSLAEWERARGVVGGKVAPSARALRALAVARLGDDALAVAEARPAAGSRQGIDVFTAARVYAVAAQIAADDGRRAPGERRESAARYGAEAIRLLARARDLGYFKTPRDKKSVDDRDFAALRHRADFLALRGDIIFPADPFAR